MPLGKTPILQNDLMAEGDNNKFLLFNDALVRLEDAENRRLVVDMTAGDVTLTESQVLRNSVFRCAGHTVARILTLPATVGSGSDPLNRKIAVRNIGTASVTVTFGGGGSTVNVPADSTALLYGDGTDVVSLGGISNSATLSVQDDGVEVVAALEAINFTGTGYTVAATGGIVTIDITVPDSISDFPEFSALAGQSGKFPQVNPAGTGFDYVTITEETAATIKTKYESNADTNAFTDAEKAKLAAIEAGATADMDATEIKTAYESNPNTNAFTDAEKSKLAGLEAQKYKGTYLTDTALTAAHPAPVAGSYAYVDSGVGTGVVLYIWDDSDSLWTVVSGGGGGGTETSASIKLKYEANPDTNAFTDSEKAKLFGIETGATADMSGAEIVSAIDTQLGSTAWQSGGGGAGIAEAPIDGNHYVRKDGAWETIPREIAVSTKGVNHVLILADAGTYVRMDNAAANTLTVPDNATVPFPVGTVIQLRQVGAGQTTVVASAGVNVTTSETLKLRKAGSSAALIKVDIDVWDLTGDLEPLP